MRPILSLSTDTYRTTPIEAAPHRAIPASLRWDAPGAFPLHHLSTLPEGAAGQRWLSAVRFRMETPPGFPVRGTRARSQQSRNKGRPSPGWTPGTFLSKPARVSPKHALGTAHARPQALHYSLQVSPKLFPRSPANHRRRTQSSQTLASHPTLHLLNPPPTFPPTTPNLLAFIGNQKAKPRKKMPSRGASLHPISPVTETKSVGRRRWKGGRRKDL